MLNTCVSLGQACGVDYGGIMLDFQEELEKFKPSREVGDMEDVIIGSDTVDVADIIMEIIKEDNR